MSSNTVVCRGNNNGILTVSSYSGTIVRWEHSANANGPWSSMAFQSSTYNYINLGDDTYFRAVVQLTGYAEDFSNTVLVSCDAPSAGGFITAPATNCTNTPLICTVSGYTGSIVSWDYSTTNWITRTSIASTSSVFTVNNFSITTGFRVRIQNGTCPPAFATIITVTPALPSSAGMLSGTQQVCAGSNSGTITLAGFTGTIQGWESAASAGGPFYAISNSQMQSALLVNNLTQSSYYKVHVQNSNCPVATSAVFTVAVDQPGSAGYIQGTSSVCAGTNSGTLQLIANTASIIDWELSNNGTNFTTTANNQSTFSFSNLAAASVYRVKVKNGVCPAIYSGTVQVSVNPLPAPSFTVKNVCHNAPATFTNSTAGNASYFWDFGDGYNSSLHSPGHQYSSPGIFLIKLQAQSPAGCSAFTTVPITVYPRPNASFLSADTNCYGTPMTFLDNSSISSGSISGSALYFGKVTPTAPFIPQSFIFPAHGIYKIRMVSISTNGCKDSMDKIIQVFPKPVSDFVGKNQCEGSSISFTNTSYLASGSLQHHWDFGSGSSSLVHPAFMFAGTGAHVIILISTSDHGCKDTAIRQIQINANPTLSLSVTNACLYDSTKFQMQTMPYPAIKSYTLSYGDDSQAAAPIHKYKSAGNYAVIYSAVTDSGCVNTVSASVVIYPVPVSQFSKKDICLGDSSRFINQSSVSGGSLSCHWSLMSGVSSLNENPCYKYSQPGQFAVKLKVLSSAGCTDSVTHSITVFEKPICEFDFTSACDGTPVELQNKSSIQDGSGLAYQWDLGDNTQSTSQNNTKQYLNPGSYSVKLIATSTHGCSDTVQKIVPVFEGPVADFTASNNCINADLSFVNTSQLKTGSFTSDWQFGDNSQAISKNSPQYRFRKAGTYRVLLKIMSDKGCADSTTHFVTAYPLPSVNAGRDTLVEKGNQVQLRASGAEAYTWYPAEGLSNPSIFNPSYKAFQSTFFVVSGVDENGCENTDTVQIEVKEEFLVVPYNVLTPDKNGLNENWQIKNIEAYPANNVRIIDQWNREVYYAEGYHNQWDGRDLNGDILPDATYYYILSFANSQKQYSGFITLLRNKK